MLRLNVPPTAAAAGGFRPDAATSGLLLTRDGQRCWLHAPPEAGEALPLLVVCHGAGKD